MQLIGSDIQMKPINNNSSISAIGVDEFRQFLKIQFRAGSCYIYKDVSLVLLSEIMQTEQPEKLFYNSVVGLYEYLRIKKAPTKWIMPNQKKLKGK